MVSLALYLRAALVLCVSDTVHTSAHGDLQSTYNLLSVTVVTVNPRALISHSGASAPIGARTLISYDVYSKYLERAGFSSTSAKTNPLMYP